MSKGSEKVKRNRDKKGALINSLKDVPCADCDVKYPPWVMQFDHVRGEKHFILATAVRSNISIQRIMDEVAKCEVVCANCHHNRTYMRRIGGPATVGDAAPPLRE